LGFDALHRIVRARRLNELKHLLAGETMPANLDDALTHLERRQRPRP